MDIVENEVGEIQMNKIDNVITDDEINNDIDDKEEELLLDQDIEEEENEQ